jgi:uncharacterized protein YcbK (DUF882 family)
MSTAFENHLQQKVQLRYFKPREFLMKGASHSQRGHRGFNLNTDPPRAVWDNIVATAKALDELRDRLGAPIRIISAYRSSAYNKAISGATHSQHVDFRAIDFTCDWGRPDKWAQELIDMRHARVFKGGIGKYKTFIHIDTRGWNADW